VLTLAPESLLTITGIRTITLEYDNLDRLISETNPQGAVGYTYDIVGRRKTMTVPGQAEVDYNYVSPSLCWMARSHI